MILEDGQLSLDGLHTVNVTGDADPVSGNSIIIKEPRGFNVDTKAPVLTLNSCGLIETFQVRINELLS